jgi:hypothetical protein
MSVLGECAKPEARVGKDMALSVHELRKRVKGATIRKGRCNSINEKSDEPARKGE